jgi:hypothetical protein
MQFPTIENNGKNWPAHDCRSPLVDGMPHLLDGILQFLDLTLLSTHPLALRWLLLANPHCETEETKTACLNHRAGQILTSRKFGEWWKHPSTEAISESFVP